jgi:hypothetical protein
MMEKPIQLAGERFGEATVTALLPHIGNAQSEDVTPDG